MWKQKNPEGHRLLFIILVIGLGVLTSCRSHSDHPTIESSPADEIVSSTPPFKTKEPEYYRAIRTLTINDASGKSVSTRTIIARNGEMRRDEHETAESQRVIFLEVPQGRFILLPQQRLFSDLNSEIATAVGSDTQLSDFSPERLLHNDPTSTTYQKLGNEVIAGHNASKYRVVVNTSIRGIVSTSETLIWIDDALAMPIRSETRSNGSLVTMELSDISLDVDSSLFQIPEGYGKVAPSLLRQRIRGN
jgi:hypothetical protein